MWTGPLPMLDGMDRFSGRAPVSQQQLAADGRAARPLARMAVVWVPSALTAIAFALLYRFDLVGQVRLPILLALLVLGAMSGEVSSRRLRAGASPAVIHALVAVQFLGVTAIIYAIGWGPTLAVGYVFVAARAIDEVGSHVWRPALIWTIVGIALGQLAIATGIVASYVKSPYVHGLRALSALGIAFVIWLLAAKT